MKQGLINEEYPFQRHSSVVCSHEHIVAVTHRNHDLPSQLCPRANPTHSHLLLPECSYRPTKPLLAEATENPSQTVSWAKTNSVIGFHQPLTLHIHSVAALFRKTWLPEVLSWTWLPCNELQLQRDEERHPVSAAVCRCSRICVCCMGVSVLVQSRSSSIIWSRCITLMHFCLHTHGHTHTYHTLNAHLAEINAIPVSI